MVLAPEGLDCQQFIGDMQCVIGKEQVIDLNQTPQQEPRRKHRPKVVREGKPVRRGRKATPKPVTLKATERPNDKRKYVLETQSEALGECVESKNAKGVKSPLQSLNFFSELRCDRRRMHHISFHVNTNLPMSLEFQDNIGVLSRVPNLSIS